MNRQTDRQTDRQSNSSTKRQPPELDLNLNALRAEKILEIRALMKELDDLDAAERVLNRQTATIALHATTHANGNGKALSKRAKQLLLSAAPEGVEDEEPSRPRRKKHRRKADYVPVATVKDQILVALRRRSLQSGAIQTAIEERFSPPWAAQSTLNRALHELREAGQLVMHKPNGARYALYSLSGGNPKRAAAKAAAAKKKRPEPNATRENAFSMSRAVLHALVDGNPEGMTIPEVTAVLEKDPNVKWLEGYTHNTQVSWNLKGHRNRHRIKTITQRDGTRIHKALRPAISVTKG